MLNSITGAELISSRPLTANVDGVVMKIKVLRGCGANGRSLEANRIYSVPDEVSAEDANILILMGLAKEIQEEKVVQEMQGVEVVQIQEENVKEKEKEVVQEIQEEKKQRPKRGRPRKRRK